MMSQLEYLQLLAFSKVICVFNDAVVTVQYSKPPNGRDNVRCWPSDARFLPSIIIIIMMMIIIIIIVVDVVTLPFERSKVL